MDLSTSSKDGSTQRHSMLLMVVVVVTWVLYIPFAWFLLAVSAMVGDSGQIKIGMGVMVLCINLIPLVIMVVTTKLALNRKSVYIALIPLCLFVLVQSGQAILTRVSSHTPKESISFGESVPKLSTLFVCNGDVVLEFSTSTKALFDVTSSVTVGGWHDTGGSRHFAEYKFGKYVISDQKDQDRIRTCKNPNGETIAQLIEQTQPDPSMISFTGFVPTSTAYFVCPNEKVLGFDGKGIKDVTGFVSKSGWTPLPSYARWLGELKKGPPNELRAYNAEAADAMESCKNIEGETIVDVVGMQPMTSY